MKVYKATDADMTCSQGSGRYRYTPGVPATSEASKCGITGLHACEYVADCLRYYSLGSGHRFFVAEAGGSIAEDGTDTRIACTELTLTEELSNRDIAREIIRYILRHPKRNGWEYTGYMITVAADSAETDSEDGIAIARGENPKAKGRAGSHMGWIRETAAGIEAAKLLTVSGPVRPDTWYTLEEAETAVRQG